VSKPIPKPNTINLAPGLDLPIDAVTESFAIIGRRGSGKTHTASVLAEGMLEAGQQVVIIDPTNAWWGLRSSVDGTRDAFKIPIFGGGKGGKADVEIEDTMGRDLADAVIETGTSAIVCVRDFSNAGVRRFVGDFAEQLYDRKCEKQFRTPLHLALDEADLVVPQHIQRGGERAYGAIDKIVRRGRIDGFGTSLISQRPAVIAKDVLTQTEVLVCHQVTGPHDQIALKAWVERHGAKDKLAEFLKTLPGLQKGESWFWSPAWLELFLRIKTRPRKTWDSSRTPKVNEVVPEPAHMTAVDVEEIRKNLLPKATPSKAKGKRGPAPPLDVSSIDAAELEGLQEENAALRRQLATVSGIEHEKALDCLHRAQKELAQAIEWIAADKAAARAAGLDPTLAQPPSPRAPAHRETPEKTAGRLFPSSAQQLTKCARGLLVSLLQNGEQTLEQAAICAGYSPTSGSVSNAAGELRAKGLVDGSNVSGMKATGSGKAAIPNVPPIQSGAELLTYWQSKLEKCPREMLGVIVKAYPKALSLQVAAEKCGYSPTSGSVSNAAGRLRTLALVAGGNAGMTANPRLVR